MCEPRLLDLFCGAGGAGAGYARAGFDVTGVDNRPMPRNPHRFIQADALEYVAEHGHEYDVIHASPPCQAYSVATSRTRRAEYRERADLVAETRALVQMTELPYVIENVPTAPLNTTIVLCGSMFDLDVRRHRHFESNVGLLQPMCQHQRQTPRFRSLCSQRSGKLASVVGVHGHINYPGEFALRCRAMGIDWMMNDELSQAIPPAYTEFIGHQLLSALQRKKVA